MPTPPARIAAKEIARHDRSYMAREIIQCTLPHRNPGDVQAWSRRNGSLTLILQPGIDKSTLKNTGFPYGSIPRLLLFWMTSEAVRTRSRTLQLGHSLNAFLVAVGLNPKTGRGKRGDATRLKEQMQRLLRCRISFIYEEGNATRGRESSRDMLIAVGQDTWWDYHEPDQGSLFESHVILSEEFFKAITAAPVPLDFEALSQLKRSPFALDLYAWTSWRVWTLRESGQQQVEIPLPLLQQQFGAEYKRLDNFKAALGEGLASVQEVFPGLDYTLAPGKLIIRSGKSPVPKVTAAKHFRKIEQPSEDKVTMLTKGKFSALYPGHDVKACTRDFKDWIAKREINPRDIDKLFLSFAKKWVAEREG